MASIIVYYDPSGVSKREEYEVDEGTLLSDWVMEKWETIDIPHYFYLNDTTERDFLFSIPLDDDIDELPDRIISGDDIIHIVRYPQNPIVFAVIAVVISVASSFLLRPNIPIPEIPEFEDSSRNQSPNNQLTGQTNIARPLQRIPDLYGKNKVYPDLISPTYFEFISNVKFVTEYLCIGRGEYLVEDVRSGDTLISNIPNSTVTIFEPNTAPATILTVRESNEVNGQELAAPNDAGTLDITAKSSFHSSTKTITSRRSQFSAFASFNIGDTFDVTGTVSNNATFTFQSYTIDFIGHIPIYTVEVQESLTEELNVSGVNFTSAAGKASEYGPFVVPGNPDEIWIDIICPKGLQEIDGTARNTIQVDFDIKVQELDSGGSPVGGLQTFSQSIEANTQDAQNITLKVVATDLTNPGQPHEVSVERTSNTTNDATKQIFDLTKWTRMAGVEILINFDPGNVTTAIVNTEATEQATSIQNREFNAVVTRKLITYDTDTQTLTTTPAATAKMADAALHHLTDSFLGNKATSEIDLDELYEIQDRLDADKIYGDALGRFCYSFSDSQTPIKDELETILNAGRCMSYPDGSTVRFVRDEIRDNRVALFNSRIKGKAAENKTVNFFRPGDNDGVELRFTDETTGEATTILLPDPSGGSNNLRINAAGIKNFDQAWNRATYELEKMKLQRTSVLTKVTNEGILPRINDRVTNQDGTNISAQGGEVIGVDGLTLETNQGVDFGVEISGTVILSADNGDLSNPLNCIPRTDDIDGFTLTELPSFGIFTNDDINQVGTLYNFFSGDETNQKANDYLIAKISPTNNDYVNLILVNYRPEIYDADTTVPPTL